MVKKILTFKTTLLAQVFFIPFSLVGGNTGFAQIIYQQDELIRFSGGKPKIMDPTKTDDLPGMQILQDLFEGLTRVDKNGKIILAIALSYKMENNGKTYTFKIRPDAKWSDGSKVTAEHCAFGISRLVDPKTNATGKISSYPILNSNAIMEGKLPLQKLGVKALDAETLKIDLSYPFPQFLELLSSINYVCLNPKNFKPHTNPKNSLALLTNSAYLIKKYQLNKYIELQNNPFYYNKDNVKINHVFYYFTEDMQSQINMYLTGQANLTSANIYSDQIPFLQKRLGTQLKINHSPNIIFLHINTSAKPFKDNLKLRQAISMVIDRDMIIKNILAVEGTASYDLVPTKIEGYTPYVPDWAKTPYQERVSEAKKLYTAAGYSEKKPLEITINYNINREIEKIVNSIADMLRINLGVKVNLQKQEFKDYMQSLSKGNFEISINRRIPTLFTPTEFLTLLISTNPQNLSHMKDPKFDLLLNQAQMQSDPEKKILLLEKAAAIGMENYTVIPLIKDVARFLMNYDLQGYTGNDPFLKLYSQDLYFMEVRREVK
jgi:oligopeptide transport system substrate-binding protein